MPEVLLTREVATYLRLTPKTVRALVHQRKLAAVRLGHKLLFRRADVERAMKPSKEA